ncbi:hypothetical protein NDU88_001291 [Pleurodeles waltl]|uniref:Uncharacterized protein n=1 Tax=Pleurodeles waltl TaxID=8319 RepID=A0AAV7WKF8_PLEWA|nr:hypothetical protein NDU88_001291 [Pleurodeles waltl]
MCPRSCGCWSIHLELTRSQKNLIGKELLLVGGPQTKCWPRDSEAEDAVGPAVIGAGQEIPTDVKERESDVAELGQQVDTHDAQEEELDHYRQEILALQDSNCELQYRLEDLENRAGLLLACRLRAQMAQRRVNAIQTQFGTVTNNEGLILKQFEVFYAYLYTAEQLDD